MYTLSTKTAHMYMDTQGILEYIRFPADSLACIGGSMRQPNACAEFKFTLILIFKVGLKPQQLNPPKGCVPLKLAASPINLGTHFLA